MTWTTRNVPANEDGRGNLSGYEATCECGLVLRNSMRTGLEFDVALHERWHAGTDRGVLAPVPGPEGSAR